VGSIAGSMSSTSQGNDGTIEESDMVSQLLTARACNMNVPSAADMNSLTFARAFLSLGNNLASLSYVSHKYLASISSHSPQSQSTATPYSAIAALSCTTRSPSLIAGLLPKAVGILSLNSGDASPFDARGDATSVYGSDSSSSSQAMRIARLAPRK